MGREIRRVPPNWEHPKDERGYYIPIFDQDFEAAAREWLDNCIAWDNGTHEDIINNPDRKSKYPFYWLWSSNAPKEGSYRPKFTEPATWYQMYETVSEGTPTTPPFSSKAELVDYLVKYGEFEDRRGWNRENAEKFVEAEWAPSMMITNIGGVVTIKTPRDGA